MSAPAGGELLSSPALAALLRACPGLAGPLRGADRAAATDAPVLIVGEAGSGRSSVARALHAASGRAAGPLVEVDPGSLPSSLFESELFGHRAGAFTGADRDHPGRLARADGGTLVLDHVEEIPVAAQPKLLRVLGEGRYAPLGGAERATDVRVIAIGPDDLAARVERGALRRDLFHRLEVLAFRLPPLRERPGDLDALIEFFLADLAERFGCDPLELSAAARDWMRRYPWPGNLREVRNTLERALVIGGGELLDPPPPRESGGPPASLAETEREQILAALAWSRGHQGRAAEILGISRKALWEKRKRYGIP